MSQLVEMVCSQQLDNVLVIHQGVCLFFSYQLKDEAGGQETVNAPIPVKPGAKRTARSLSCSSALAPSPRDPVIPKDGSAAPHAGGPLSDIPEQADSVLSRKVLKKLTKFYSVPSFAQTWMQCGMQQAYCPSNSFQACPRPWMISSRVNCFNCFNMSRMDTYALQTK